jgi:hypothetical protein
LVLSNDPSNKESVLLSLWAIVLDIGEFEVSTLPFKFLKELVSSFPENESFLIS